MVNNFYYSMVLYIEKFPLDIECDKILIMVDEICFLLGCTYDRLGYILLHPDYDFKNLGKMMVKNADTKEKFKNLKIPLKYYGKREKTPSSPSIYWELSSKSIFIDSIFSISIAYPELDGHYLRAEIQIEESLMDKKFSLDIFEKIQRIFIKNRYMVNTALLHYYFGNGHNMILSGGETTFMTIDDGRILDHAINYGSNWKNRIMDIFYINSIRKNVLPEPVVSRVRKIVGDKNMIEDENMIIFKLPQLQFFYLLNRVVPAWSRQKLKRIFQKEGLCNKDVSILLALLRL